MDAGSLIESSIILLLIFIKRLNNILFNEFYHGSDK
jgi:hypothetical protein